MHREAIGLFYDDIVRTLVNCVDSMLKGNKKNFKARPGWSDLVSDMYDASRDIKEAMADSWKTQIRALI